MRVNRETTGRKRTKRLTFIALVSIENVVLVVTYNLIQNQRHSRNISLTPHVLFNAGFTLPEHRNILCCSTSKLAVQHHKRTRRGFLSLLERSSSFTLHIGYGKAAIEPAVLSHGPSPELEGKLPSTLRTPRQTARSNLDFSALHSCRANRCVQFLEIHLQTSHQ